MERVMDGKLPQHVSEARLSSEIKKESILVRRCPTNKRQIEEQGGKFAGKISLINS